MNAARKRAHAYRDPGDWKLLHRLWIEGPESLARMPWILRVAAFAAAVYGTGLVIASFGGLFQAYTQSPAFVIGALGCGFVAVAVAQRARKIDTLYFDLSSTFVLPRSTFLSEIGARFTRACSPGRHLIYAGLIAVPFVLGAYLAAYADEVKILEEPVTSLRPIGFASSLYSPDLRLSAFVVIAFFAIAISISLGTSLALVVAEVRILNFLRTLPVPPLAEAVRMRLRPLADFHLHISRDWTAGFILFLILFFAQLDAVSIALLSGVATVALALFVVPQLILRDVILRAHRRATDIALGAWPETEGDDGIDVAKLAALSELSMAPRYWVYGSGEIMYWLLAQAVAVGALVAQISQQQ